MDSGIYKITCKTSGKFYIGSSQELNRRKIHHYNRLRANKHGNPHLQNSYNLYGEDDIIFEVLEHCEVGRLLDVEQIYIDRYKGKNIMFNVAEVAGASMRNRRHKKETIQKIRKSAGSAWRGKHLPDDVKEKISNRRMMVTREKGLRKLTDNQVREIRRMKDMGIGDRTIAKRFNISRTIVINIKKGRKYKDVV
jgi:group I intron endonuclease